MLIDWFTVGAQIVNFMVLVFLMRRFLFKPVLKAMQEREETIAQQFEEAEEKARNAETEAEDLRRQCRDIEEQREKVLTRARQEASALKLEWEDEARRQVQSARARWLEELTRQKQAFLRDLESRTREQVFSIARRTLEDLADADLERQMLEAFLRRLSHLGPEERQTLTEAVSESGNLVTISTSFPLAPEQRSRLQQAVRTELAADGAEIRFRQAPDLVSGLELTAGGRRLSWNLSSYLEAMEQELAQAIDDERASLTPDEAAHG